MNEQVSIRWIIIVWLPLVLTPSVRFLFRKPLSSVHLGQAPHQKTEQWESERQQPCSQRACPLDRKRIAKGFGTMTVIGVLRCSVKDQICLRDLEKASQTQWCLSEDWSNSTAAHSMDVRPCRVGFSHQWCYTLLPLLQLSRFSRVRFCATP